MKIGIIGPSDSLNRISNYLEDFSKDIAFIQYEALSLNDAIKAADISQHEVDGILYSGEAVSGAATSQQDIKVPHEYISHSAFGILSLIYNQVKEKTNKISFDFVSEKILSEIPIDMEKYTFKTLPYQVYYDEADYIEFHKKSLKEGAGIIITSFTSVYNYFNQKNIPVYRLHTLKFDIQNSLNLLISKVEKKRISDAQICVQIIKHQFDPNIEKYDFEHKRLIFEQALNEFARKCSGSLKRKSGNEYFLYSTKNILHSDQALQAFFNLIAETDFAVYSGISSGYTVFQSELKAERALNYSEKEGHSNVCLVDDNGVLKGPFLSFSKAFYEPSLQSHLANEIATKVKLSEAYIQRVYRMMKTKNVSRFTAKEFAHYLNISDRSANRIFKKLIDGGYASVVDTLMVNKSGRPFKIVEIKFE